jgi:hypothetical protein
MLGMAGGGWQVYQGKKGSYQKKVRILLPEKPDDTPWLRWAIPAIHFRLWNPRDPLELEAGLKWAVDVLVEEGWVIDDAPKYLVHVAEATQEINRKLRGVELSIERRP